MVTMDNGFADWLEKQIADRGWSIRHTADKAKVSHVHLSYVLNGTRGVGHDFCSAIARAFNLPADDVFRRAGLLPPAPERTPGLIEAEHLFTLLKPGQRELLLQTMRAWVSTDPITEDAET